MWPSESLTSLNRSRSSISTAPAAPLRWATATSRASSSMNRRRLKSPVSESLVGEVPEALLVAVAPGDVLGRADQPVGRARPRRCMKAAADDHGPHLAVGPDDPVLDRERGARSIASATMRSYSAQVVGVDQLPDPLGRQLEALTGDPVDPVEPVAPADGARRRARTPTTRGGERLGEPVHPWSASTGREAALGARARIFVQRRRLAAQVRRARTQSSNTSPARASSTGAPNAREPSLARPLGVELVGDVGEHDPLGAGAAGVLAGLLRGQVAADAGALGPRQGRLDEQQVGVPRDLDELVAGPAVGAEGEAPRARDAG